MKRSFLLSGIKYGYLILLFLLGRSVLAQTKLSVIKATTKKVAINDGGFLDKNAWQLSPGIRPDVYTADRSRKAKWVTFYTDIDSIRVKVKPGTRYTFVVLLNGKDSCFTQIASAIPPEDKSKKQRAINDTIPFKLTAYNAISVKSVINDTDTLTLHFDMGSYDFHLTKDAVLKKTQLLSNQPDALAGKLAPNYNRRNKVFKLQMGNKIWNNPDVGVTDLTAHEMDGRFGWNLFEGQSVELDYDRNLLIIHSDLPKDRQGYLRSKLLFIHSFVCAKGRFEIAGKKYAGNFLMDTGSDQAIIVDSTWASKQNFPQNLKLLRLSVLRDPRGNKFESRIVLTPLFKINGFYLSNVPALVLNTRNPAGFPINDLGNDLLKRFNMILDLKNDYLYLKPNKLMEVKYRENS